MKKELVQLKERDWSLNLEEPYYESNAKEMLQACVNAVQHTKSGRYVNLVTPGIHGDPRSWLIPELTVQLEQIQQPVREIRYIDECGCGGFVTRVFC